MAARSPDDAAAILAPLDASSVSVFFTLPLLLFANDKDDDDAVLLPLCSFPRDVNPANEGESAIVMGVISDAGSAPRRM
jgi:hypothetical protein